MADTILFPSITPTQDSQDEHDPIEAAFENGECPWCGEPFDNVKAHASQAHSDEWNAWKEG